MNESMIDLFKKIGYYTTKSLFSIGGNSISVASILFAIIIIYLAIKISRLAEKTVNKFLGEKEVDSGVTNAVSTFAKYIVMAVGIFVSLDLVGISLSSLTAIGAVLMVGIGFGLQNIAQNFISGLIILLERPIKVGDVVEVKDISGRVIEIGARSTLIHTRDDVAIIVPNSQFISEQVVNESYSGNQIRLELKLGVAYGSDVELVRQSLLEVGKSHSKIIDDTKTRVFFDDFSDSSLDFTLLFWVNDLWLRREILSDMRFSIDEKFKEKGISIPFPQRDVHLYTKN